MRGSNEVKHVHPTPRVKNGGPLKKNGKGGKMRNRPMLTSNNKKEWGGGGG